MILTAPLECTVPWTEDREKAPKQDDPLVLDARPAAQEQVGKLYLENMWVPEVTRISFCRRSLSTSSEVTHTPRPFCRQPPRLLHASAGPVEQHALFDPILLTVCGCFHKYSHDIPDIPALDEHREELETEETVIWYVFGHEKEPERAEDSQDALNEDEWRKRQLDRMEKR
jgi:hypothetical protein